MKKSSENWLKGAKAQSKMLKGAGSIDPPDGASIFLISIPVGGIVFEK